MREKMNFSFKVMISWGVLATVAVAAGEAFEDASRASMLVMGSSQGQNLSVEQAKEGYKQLVVALNGIRADLKEIPGWHRFEESHQHELPHRYIISLASDLTSRSMLNIDEASKQYVLTLYENIEKLKKLLRENGVSMKKLDQEILSLVQKK